MNQAIHSNRETPFNSLPPPYPGKHPPATISSPLLVNLLQNDGSKDPSGGVKMAGRPPNATNISSANLSSTTTAVKPPVGAQLAAVHSNLMLNNCISPSALSTNTSIRQNSTILTSTTTANAMNKPPPPQYHRALSSSSMVIQYSMTGPQNSTTSMNPQTTSLSQTIMSHTPQPAPQTNPPMQQAPMPLQQMNVYQSQNALMMKKNSLANNTIIPNNLANPLMQPNMTFNHSKHPASIRAHNLTNPVRASSVPAHLAMTRNPAPVTQSKAAISHPTSMNHSLKQALSQAMPKNLNTFASQQLNKSNFILSHALGVGNPPTSLPQPVSTVPPAESTISSTVMPRSLPSPPPYSVAITRPWDSLVHSGSLLDLTPTLTDLKADDLDALLPTLERELTQSPLPELPEDFLADHSNLISSAAEMATMNDNRKFLINPLTGELEPQSSGESDTEDLKDVFTGLPSPAALSDDDTCSTTRPDTTTDQSDCETRSSDTGKPPRLKTSKARERGRDSPALKPEKIKLRLKLEKSEPVNPAYKVDVSYVNQQPKKASSSLIAGGEELRVPPLHISLRGRNSVVIKNKTKLNADGTPVKMKVRKNADHMKLKKAEAVPLPAAEESVGVVNNMAAVENSTLAAGDVKTRMSGIEQKKFKKLKTVHEHKDIASLNQEYDLKSKFMGHNNHYKDKLKERRGSDSELVKNNKKFLDSNGTVSDDKHRRLSQSEPLDGEQVVLGSTNIGTITNLPQKLRKDKVKAKDVFKKDLGKSKIFNKNFVEKLQSKPVALPMAGEMNMEAKFKQGLLEGTTDKGVPRPPHRTEVVNHVTADSNIAPETDRAIKTTTVVSSSKQKSPLPDDGDTPDRKRVEMTDKITATGGRSPAMPSVAGGRSPALASGTGGRSPAPSAANQGEDSGIESMDALSEKSPNQASQSPHAADAPAPKTRAPDLLDIEAQLAEMEGLNGDSDRQEMSENVNRMEDVNENKCVKDQTGKKCCELTCVLQDSIKQTAVTLASVLESPTMSDLQKSDISHTPLKVKKDEDELEPLPVRVTPALYTYSNPEKGRAGSESPAISDEDSNSCSTSSTAPGGIKQSKGLLEQLLIEIPGDHQTVPSSPSPATRSSVRTRALSKMNSPELSSPVASSKSVVGGGGGSARTVPTAAKRKRNASDSSNHSTDETRKKARKTGDGAAAAFQDPHGTQPTKTRQHDSIVKVNNAKKPLVAKVQEESSDSDEPLIEKVRKPSGNANTPVNNSVVKTTTAKLKSGPGTVANINKVALVVNTGRSVRSNMPAQNTRSKGDKLNTLESEALRRKTRSTVTDMESKRKKEVK